jgi:hypothetical protein
MFNLFGSQSEEKKISDQKILIDFASDILNQSLKFYYKNCFEKKKSKKLFDGREHFYLFLCAAFGFTYEERNLSDNADEYFIQYTPIRIAAKIPEDLSGLVGGNGGVNGAFKYEKGIISLWVNAIKRIVTKECPLSVSAARTGGHMRNLSAKNLDIVPADKNYLEFKKMGSLLQDGDKLIIGIERIYEEENKKLLKIE